MTETEKELAVSRRPLFYRMLHALAEAVGILAFSSGLFVVAMKSLCLNNHQCNDMGSILYVIPSLIAALAACGILTSFFKKFRNRPKARKNLDIALLIAAVVLWATYFYRFS